MISLSLLGRVCETVSAAAASTDRIMLSHLISLHCSESVQHSSRTHFEIIQFFFSNVFYRLILVECVVGAQLVVGIL